MAQQHNYTVYFEPLPNDEGYEVVFPAIPEIVTFGQTIDEARTMATDALRCHLEALLKDGETLPVDGTTKKERIRETVALSL